MSPEVTEAPAAPVRALDMLIKDFPPTLRGRAPFWRPAAAPIEDQVYEPAWSWRQHRWVADEPVVVLDLVAAYLAAATTVTVAHSKLTHERAVQPFDRRRAGYWRIKIHPWTPTDMVSPLGTATLGDDAWVATPTAALLEDLAAEGYWPGVDVIESWTCPDTVRLRRWAEHVTGLRREAVIAHAHAEYAAIKIGYSQAVTLLGVDQKSRVHRPDWARAIRATHAANTWRKGWRAALVGHPPVAAGSVDELVFPRSSIEWMIARRHAGIPVPIKIDPSGLSLGSWRVKATYSAEQWNRR